MIFIRTYLFCGLLFLSYTASHAFDAYGDPKYAQWLLAERVVHHHTNRLEGSFQGVAIDMQLQSDVAQQAAFLNAFLCGIYATGAALAVQWLPKDDMSARKKRALDKRLFNSNYHTAKRVACTVGALCTGAYMGYTMPVEAYDQTGQVWNMFYGAVLAEVASACVGTVAGMVASS